MSTLCNQCESFNVNGVRTHERGCANSGKRIYLGDDGTLDTVIYCGKCKAEERFNAGDELHGDECKDESGNCDCYDDFVEDSLREFQDEHECFECDECGQYYEDSDEASACCNEDIEDEETAHSAEENKEIADSIISQVYEDSNHLVTCDYPSLWVRTIETEDQSPEAKKALDDALASFEGQFSFEAKQIFLNNAYGFEIELPRIIYNF
jgi:hypothetical protein